MRLGLLLLLVCAAVACGGKPPVRPRGPEWLVAIHIEGNLSVEDDALIPRLALHRAVGKGRAIDPYQLSLDTQRLRARYIRLGFFDATVKARIARGQGGAQTAVFVVDEGRRSTMQVEIRGLPPEIPFERARRLIELPDGAPFDYDAYDDAKQPLLALLEEAGYAHVQLDAAVIADRAAGVATARYELSPGVRCTFGPVAITGVEGDLAEAIGHRLAFAEGAPYAPSSLAATQRALYEIGRFSTVRIDARRTPGQAVVPVEIAVSLANRHEIKGGFGFGYDPVAWEARVRGGGSLVPLHHPLWTLFADARLAASVPHVDLAPQFDRAQPKARLGATALRLDLFRPRVTGEIGVGYDYVTVEAYTSTGPQLRLGVASPLFASWLQVRVGWTFSYLKFGDIHEILDESARRSLGLDRGQRLGAFQASVVADLRDDPIDPKYGAYFALRSNFGSPYAGSALTFTQLTPDLRGYVALGTPRLVLAARVRAGAILGDVPVTERYYAGGTQSHRGFSARRLSPTLAATDQNGVTSSVVIGGGGMLEAGVELRATVGTLAGMPLGLTAFLDGGNVTLDAYDLDPFALYWAAGAGVSVKPGGIKIRLDAAYRLNGKGPTDPEYGSNFKVHIGVGETF
ncbi:MAG: autotransporter assembly complex protein TamA [Kofleriaceae bacterium]